MKYITKNNEIIVNLLKKSKIRYHHNIDIRRYHHNIDIRRYHHNIDIRRVNDSRKFWKVVKPFFSEKQKKLTKIILHENENDTVQVMIRK